MNPDFQSENGLFKQAAFSTNSQTSSSQLQPRPSPLANPTHPSRQLNSKAAELKARLLKERERVSSATPSSGMTDHTSKESPRTPVITAGAGEEREQNLNELISQYSSKECSTNPETFGSPQKAKAKDSNTNIKKEEGRSAHDRASTASDCSAKSQAHSLGSPTKVSKPANGKMVKNGPTFKSNHASNGSTPEASEGEIIDDPTLKEAFLPTESKRTQVSAKQINNEGQHIHRPGEEPLSKMPYSRGSREESLSGSAPASPQLITHSRDDRRTEAESWPERRVFRPELRERRISSGKQPYPCREVLNEEYRRIDTRPEHKRENNRASREIKPSIPTLAQLLPYNDDLREWLEITGYHNAPYRDKILNRRRAIAALDAQRNALLAEMEAEERGGPPLAGVPSSIMLPPPIPAKSVIRPDTLPSTNVTSSEPHRDCVVSNKRPYSDLQDEEGVPKKVLRTDDRSSRMMEDNDFDQHRSRSRDYESSYRSGDRHPYGDGRGRGRGNSHERDLSPLSRHFESKTLAQVRGYESPFDDFPDHNERESNREPRPFERRGGYRGRTYDSHHRGRGGRGRRRGEP